MYIVIETKISHKMAIVLEGGPIDIYSFEIFHISLGSILCAKSEIKSDLSVESVLLSATCKEFFKCILGFKLIEKSITTVGESLIETMQF